ncbi:MAG: tRNA U-34 5-methylaminomethyl-2-thiouridine biosynthesis protein [Deltaproteobacteria bacterium]|nr:MAG: tRNA U-34 5-methylaminomethyl-2-thiouridine biosynthesis protein [Deltaproteobacteria bacterium]
MSGSIVAGVLAPHPPHLVYAENPPQNEPRAECGWEGLRWGYERLRKSLSDRDFDVIVVHSPHWKTVVGHHILGLPHFKSKSVDPIFPNLFRFNYDVSVDVDLSEAIAAEASADGLTTKLMRNPDFRVDYGTIIACHLANPAWDKPIVAISSNRSHYYFSNEVGEAEQLALGRATARAIEKSGKRALLLASNSLSHRHFTEEGELPEDMSAEHIYHHGQYLWDMRVLELMKQGRIRELLHEMPDFIEQSVSECKEGSLTWLFGALGIPDYPAEVHAYGTVIGTGNAVVEWDPRRALVEAK